MFVKNILILLGLEKSLYSQGFKNEYTPQLNTIEVLLKSPYFEKLHLGIEQSFLDNDNDIPLLNISSYLKNNEIFEGACGIFLVGYHKHVQSIAYQLKAHYFDSEIVLIKNAILAPPQGLNEDFLKFNQIQLALV